MPPLMAGYGFNLRPSISSTPNSSPTNICFCDMKMIKGGFLDRLDYRKLEDGLKTGGMNRFQGVSTAV